MYHIFFKEEGGRERLADELGHRFKRGPDFASCVLRFLLVYFSSVQVSRSVVSDSLRPHELQHARPPCPSPTPSVYSDSWWCHPAISSSVVPFSSCPQPLPASGSFPVSQLFTSGGQSIGVSASASVLPMKTQDWPPLGWTGWISLLRGEENQLTIHIERLEELRVRWWLRIVHFLWPEHWQPFLGYFLLKPENWRDRIFSVFFLSQWKELHGFMRPFSWVGGRFLPCHVVPICYPGDRCIPQMDAFVFLRETFVSWFSFLWWPQPNYMLQLILHELEF